MPLGRRPLLALVALPVLALVAGLALFGARPQAARSAPQAAGAAASGCTQAHLRFVVTDDPREVERQQVFERTSNVITDEGFYTKPQPLTPTLHAAAHGDVVVFYRPGLTPAQLAPLHALDAIARSTKAPVVIVPRPGQRDALVALGLGDQVTCAAPGAVQAATVRAFAAGIYPTVKA